MRVGRSPPAAPTFRLNPDTPAAVCSTFSLLNTWSNPMMDVVMMAIGFAFFALSIAYVYACDLL